MFSLTRKQQYGIAILAVGLTTVIRSALDPLLDGELPFFFFIFPVVLSGWLGGLCLGLFATGLSMAFGEVLLAADLLHAVSFGLVGIAFSALFEWGRRAEGEARFFSDLNAALLPLADADQILATAVRMLGEHLQVDRCAYAEAEAGKDHFAILADYVRGAPSNFENEDAFCHLGDEGRRILREKRAYVVNDMGPGAEIRSLVCVPLEKDGDFVARLAVLQKTPRRWSSEEIKVITIVANRCWESAARDRAVRRLKNSDERYRAFLSNSSESIWRYELDEPIPVTLPEDEQVELFYQRGYLAECNEAFARTHGRSSIDEIRGERLTVLLVRTEAEKIIEYSRAFVRSGYHLMGAQTRETDIHGNTRYFQSNLIGILENGALVRAWGTQLDITEQVETVNALKVSEERFAKAFRSSPDCLVISRVADGLILEINDSFAKVAGYSRDELVGERTLQLGLYADPTDRQRMVALLKEQNYVRDFEFPMKTKSGEIRLMQFSAEPLELHGEHCWLTIGHDITERKQEEEARELLLLHEKAAREEAEAANRIKDEFLATVSHELRTPLTAITGWASMLLNQPLPQAQTRHAVEVIAKSAKSQSELIADILDVSRIGTGKLKLDIRPVEIERVFQAAVDVVQPAAEAKRIALHVAVDDRHCLVQGDSSRLQQAIWNLLSNAVKFTNEGGKIEARLTVVLDRAEISITDSGIGIDPLFLPELFQQFRQADGSSTRRYGGLGLGLAIVRHVVEMHGGTVSASSRGKGLGSAFKITLPLMQEVAATETKPEAAAAGTPPEKERTLDHVRVLVVEDDPDTLDLLKLVLDESGADVVTAPSAREAVNVFEHWRPDVLVSDLAMPEEDGYQLIRQVRSRGLERGGNIPAVALTAYTRDYDRTRALAAGFQMHLAKPIEPKELIAALAALSGGSVTH
jgi:PAS domain S-box-containing protein